ncbi:MAG TPA: hypothetical protein EYP08_01795 [Pyrodictiaceae archaeon]|nr:hypothetical protein [Pyrodictiaceae archaeon]HIP85351.1 hypothetical protein [Pyrodictium sp.]HIQ10716.1 hypothetical protein [Pyrodictium sp.]HIQ55510.1 hypothetical protein [Pyrodictium sp.]
MVKTIILAAGSLKGLKSITDKPSRSLLKLGDKTILDYIVDVVREKSDKIVVVLPRGTFKVSKPDIVTVNQDISSNNVVEAICLGFNACKHEDDIYVILYGDIYAEQPFYAKPLINAEQGLYPSITVTIPSIPRPSYLYLDIDMISAKVVRVGEGNYIHAGALVLHSRDLKTLCTEMRSIQALLVKLSQRKELYADVWTGVWVDIDGPWDYMLAIRHYLSQLREQILSSEANIASTAILDGPIVVESGATIDHYAVVKGPVYVSKDSIIGAHAFIRKNVFIGSKVTVGAYTEVKRSILLDESYIASHCYIADSVIGEKASIASFTVTRNIPYRSLPREVLITTTLDVERLKIGAVITKGKKVDPHSTLMSATYY